jgi:hypothetical protein
MLIRPSALKNFYLSRLDLIEMRLLCEKKEQKQNDPLNTTVEITTSDLNLDQIHNNMQVIILYA